MPNFGGNANGLLAQQAVLWNSSAKQVRDGQGNLKLDGNPTEKALINYFVNSNASLNVMETQNALGDCLRYCTPFDPDFKYMATAVNKA